MEDLLTLIDKWKNSALDLREAETLINLLIVDNERMEKELTFQPSITPGGKIQTILKNGRQYPPLNRKDSILVYEKDYEPYVATLIDLETERIDNFYWAEIPQSSPATKRKDCETKGCLIQSGSLPCFNCLDYTSKSPIQDDKSDRPQKKIHLITQRNQPIGSQRKCCEKCGLAKFAIKEGDVFTDDESIFESDQIRKDGYTKCTDQLARKRNEI